MKEQEAQLYAFLLDEKIDCTSLKEKQRLLIKRQSDIKQKQQQLQIELSKLEQLISSKQMEKQQLQDYANMEELTFEMEETLIECIYVCNGSSAYIQWRFKNKLEK